MSDLQSLQVERQIFSLGASTQIKHLPLILVSSGDTTYFVSKNNKKHFLCCHQCYGYMNDFFSGSEVFSSDAFCGSSGEPIEGLFFVRVLALRHK